jgi:ferredoxin
MSVIVLFMPDRVSVNAEPGESLLTVADRCGVSIPTSCLQGACYVCKVALEGQDYPILACTATVPNQELSIFHLYPTE